MEARWKTSPHTNLVRGALGGGNKIGEMEIAIQVSGPSCGQWSPVAKLHAWPQVWAPARNGQGSLQTEFEREPAWGNGGLVSACRPGNGLAPIPALPASGPASPWPASPPTPAPAPAPSSQTAGPAGSTPPDSEEDDNNPDDGDGSQKPKKKSKSKKSKKCVGLLLCAFP